MLVDTNVLLRLMLADDPVQFKAAVAYRDKAQVQKTPLVIHDLVLAELVWVLKGKGWSRPQVATALSEICADPCFAVKDLLVAKAAIRSYVEKNVSFIDAFQAAYALQHDQGVVVTFDDDFDRLGVKRVEPK